MSVAKQQTKSQPTIPLADSGAKAVIRKPLSGKTAKPAASNKAKPRAVSQPLTDEQVGPIPGLPTEAEIEQQVGNLSPADKSRFTKISRLLAERLGSYAAARAWLTAPGRGFDGTPLDAIRDGMAKRVLELIRAQSSRNPPYA